VNECKRGCCNVNGRIGGGALGVSRASLSADQSVPLPSLVILPNDQQFLTRRTIVTARDIAQSTIAGIETIDDGEAQRAGTTHVELHVFAPNPDR
jgi:hypothetical protein